MQNRWQNRAFRVWPIMAQLKHGKNVAGWWRWDLSQETN
jgi:hypothetical protein